MLQRAICASLALGVASQSCDAREHQLKCDYPGYDSKRIVLPNASVRQCVDLRDSDRTEVLVLHDKLRFATDCPITVERAQHPPETLCESVPGALQVQDVVRIDEWSEGKFELRIRRPEQGGLRTVVANAPLTPVILSLPAQNGGTREELIGYYVDVVLDPLKPLEVVRYYVYLELAYDANRRPYKSYAIEVFDRDAQCIGEEPSPAISRLIECSNPAAFDVDMESPAGGGGEPPPGSKP